MRTLGIKLWMGLAAVLVVLPPAGARADGIWDFIFGRRPAPPRPAPVVYPVLRSGQAVAALGGLMGTRLIFQVPVPPGTRSLEVATAGGAGDCDLYISREQIPEPKSYEHASAGRDTRERIVVPRPAPGTWYVLVHAYSRFEGATLTISWDSPPPPPVPVPPPVIRPWVRFTAPVAGAIVTAGQPTWIEWRSSGHSRNLRILQSSDAGRTWLDITPRPGVPAGAGRLAWTVADWPGGPDSLNVQLRIVDLDDPAVSDTCQPIVVVRPRGGPGRDFPPREGGFVHRPSKVDAYEPDDTTGRASPIGLGTEQVHTIYGEEEDEDWILFTPPTTGTYRVTFQGVTVKLEVRLYSTTVDRTRENKLRTFDVGTGGTTLDLDVPPTLRYYKIRVMAKDDEDTGVYRILVQRVVPAPPDGRPRR